MNRFQAGTRTSLTDASDVGQVKYDAFAPFLGRAVVLRSCTGAGISASCCMTAASLSQGRPAV